MSQWYYARAGQQLGPVSAEALQGLARSGELSPTELVWSEGMPAWAEAKSIDGLFAPEAPAPPQAAAQPGGYGVGQYAPTAQGPTQEWQGGYAPAAPAPAAYGQPGYPAAGYAPGGYAPGGYAPGAPLPYYTPPPAVPYAGFWIRFAAYFIDSLIVGIPLYLILFGILFAMGVNPFDTSSSSFGPPASGARYAAPGRFSARTAGNPAAEGVQQLFNLVNIAVSWLYYALQESGPHQATLGKRLFGLKVIDQNGQRIGFGRASGRFFGKILSGCLCAIGYIMAAFTERKQALHDIMAGTFVIRTR
jgi:uncharacterized RDD family membrane protein YckC